MKANDAPEKIYLQPSTIEELPHQNIVYTKPLADNSIEYIRTDAFIEKALKWYCLDCECNDNCKDTKCFFYREYERYLKGEVNALPPKFSCGILNEDGSTSENWRYRHFTTKMTDAFVEKAAKWLDETLRNTDFYENEIELMVEKFKEAMKL